MSIHCFLQGLLLWKTFTQLHIIASLTRSFSVQDWNPTSPTVLKTLMKLPPACRLGLLQSPVTVSTMLPTIIPQIESVHTSINILQLDHYPMHPALMAQYDSAMVTSQERVGWRSASAMPGALCVMMDGIIQMLPLSAGSWATIQLVRIPCTVVKY